MKKHKHYWLIIGSSLILSGTIVGALTATILISNKTQHWNINPYQKYDFNKVKSSLLKSEVPAELVSQYLKLTKKITGVTKTNEIIKASELLTLDNKIMNAISQRIIWNNENTYQVQSKIDLIKPILIQFYEYYDHVYIYQNNLQNDSLNNMQLKSSNTDLYKWSIGANISDYSLIKNYLTSAQEAWISKMSMSYIFETFLNKKIVLYNSLINQVNDEITKINQQIEALLGHKNQLLNAKIDAQNHKILVSNMFSSINSWETKLDTWYSLTIIASAAQLAMTWFPPIAWALTEVTLGFGLKYSAIENQANNDLNLQTNDIKEWLGDAGQMSDWLGIIFDVVAETFVESLSQAIIVTTKILGWVMSFVGMTLLSVDFGIQKNMFAKAKAKVGNSDSDVSKVINTYIDDIDNQMNNISITINNLNIKENDYMNQKILFNNKLKQLSNDNQFFKDFNNMNNQTFTETNLFTTNQIKNWQQEVERKYGYLTKKSTTTDDFISAFTNEKNNFNNKYLNIQNQEQQFINNYNNNDKEYFIKSLLSYIDNPLKNNLIYFNDLNLTWNDYDDIFKK